MAAAQRTKHNMTLILSLLSFWITFYGSCFLLALLEPRHRKASKMASMAATTIFPKLQFNPKCHNFSQVIDPIHVHIRLYNATEYPSQRLFLSSGRNSRHSLFPAFAVGSGLESSITEQKKKSELSLVDVKISVESHDDEKINVRVDLPAKETQKVFDDVLTSLARTAPPAPGFRKLKGGKTSNVPKSFLLQMLGKGRVTKFVIQEILSITVGDFVKKENLKVNPQFKTIQTEQELEAAFTPGSEFGFNATLELEKSDSDLTSQSSES